MLASIGSSPVPDGQTAQYWVEISHDGRYLFAINTGSTNLSRYKIRADGSLVLLGSTTFNNGVGAADARLSPDGRTLSVTGGRGLVVSTFAVNGAKLTELASSRTSLPAGRGAIGRVLERARADPGQEHAIGIRIHLIDTARPVSSCAIWPPTVVR